MAKQFQSDKAPVMDQTKEVIHDIKTDPIPFKDKEPVHKIPQTEITAAPKIYLKPIRTIGDKMPFNEAFREEYNFMKEMVCFIAEHKEIIGEKIEVWTKPYRGIAAEYWEIPPGKPVYGPRYLAEQITKCRYKRLKAENGIRDDGTGIQTFGGITVDTIVQRLDAIPANQGRTTIFMS